MTDTAGKALIEMHADAVRNLAAANERIAKMAGCLRDCREMMAHELSDLKAGDLIEKINEILGDRDG